MTCNEVMTPAPVTCRPGDAIVDAARLMRSYDVGSLPVVKDDESQMLIGVITDRDIAIRVVGEGRNPADAKVADAMSTEVVSCTTTDPYQEASCGGCPSWTPSGGSSASSRKPTLPRASRSRPRRAPSSRRSRRTTWRRCRKDGTRDERLNG